jgi:hypothetical protein
MHGSLGAHPGAAMVIHLPFINPDEETMAQ